VGVRKTPCQLRCRDSNPLARTSPVRVIQEKGKALSRFSPATVLKIYTPPDYAVKTAKTDYMYYNVLI
jgi:hypothetical protein